MTRPHLYWSLSFRVRQYVKSSLWVVPMIGGFAGYGLSWLATWAEQAGDLPKAWTYSPSTALTVLTTIVAASVGLTGFVVTVAVLVVQTATGTFSARYLRLWYRDGMLKAVLAVLIGTFIFSFALLRRVEDPDTVPNIGVTLCGFSLGAGAVLFLVLLDRAIHPLRPVAVASLVARTGRESFRSVAALSSRERLVGEDEIRDLAAGTPAFVARSRRAGAIQAFDERALIGWARAHDCVLVVPNAVGDFVSRGGPLVEVHGDAESSAMTERILARLFVLGVERTIDQDPAFALRVLVDVAIRALSPAVNDPTTATQVMDHLEDTLAEIGGTRGLDGRWELADDAGRLRVVMPAQRWEQYLSLGVTEIREYGATSIQVMRRLRALLLALRDSVLPEHTAAVEQELERLEQSAVHGFGETVDRDLAGAVDRQGIGGARPLV